ncbi:MAG: DUF4230 domain-containing protein [Candidatus Promineifilaceae bacterium]|nr:DUF4230 domain-containing protein [Candidatus Promineifilaceae bacterium]
MRKLAYLVVIVFFGISALAVFSIWMAVNTTQQAVEPIGDMVRRLVIPATPVVLPDPQIIVREVRTLARLETSAMSFEKIIRAEREQDLLFGVFGEELLFVAHGEVIAGVDLMQMTEEDVQVLGPETVVVHLPEPEIFNTVLDNERSYVANRDRGFLARQDPHLETQVRSAAEQELTAAALEAGILEQANVNAEDFMRGFLEQLGFAEIRFVDETPPPAPPYEQEIPKGYSLTPVAP